ncbi:MAG TPA: ADYC domain-containing protein [Kofleriaceae bacterium]|nr:ADYC domain-containing protein [Kofleriaceae bacterium]
MSRTVRLCSLLIPALALAACADPATTGGGELAFQGGGGQGGCPEWGCTGNSPVIGPYELHELDLDGSPNTQGVSIGAISLNGVPVRVVFKGGDQIYAVDDNQNVYSGTQLDHLTFFLRTPTTRYDLVVTQVTPKATSNTRFWVGKADQIETYELQFADEAHPNELRPVCKNPPPSEGGGENWPASFESILFQGDRYDGTKKVVIAASYEESRNWFNIACAGSVIAKLHLNRHTTAGSDDDHRTHPEERQALLKMYTGDFCGEGYAFTQAGTPLHWQNAFGWRKLDGTEVGFESWWDSHGALCLTSHRLGSAYYDAVAAACGLPACEGNPFPKEWLDGAYLETAVPQ